MKESVGNICDAEGEISPSSLDMIAESDDK